MGVLAEQESINEAIRREERANPEKCGPGMVGPRRVGGPKFRAFLNLSRHNFHSFFPLLLKRRFTRQPEKEGGPEEGGPEEAGEGGSGRRAVPEEAGEGGPGEGGPGRLFGLKMPNLVWPKLAIVFPFKEHAHANPRTFFDIARKSLHEKNHHDD